ncbi:helix-turn-helix domain-containing protein [Streptomyces sp. URMC 129]|uniref:helix-turn-helix domain-containing protein n=1 Tax=Streptomyces sp. URMC 129 TaxID=3423407 RepID=UPI003F1B3BC7
MPRSAPITDHERERVRHLHAEGKNRNQIARELGRSGSTISKIARELGLSFERGPEVVAATEARRIDLADRRAKFAEALHDEAERLLAQMRQPARVWAFGGKDNEYNQEWHPEPPPADKRALMATIGTAVDRSLKLVPIETSGGAEEVSSMLGKLGTALHAAFTDDQDDTAPPDTPGDDGG